MIPNGNFFSPTIVPFFYAIPGMVFTSYEVSRLREEMNERLTEIEQPKGQTFVHNGFRKAYRDHFK